VTIYTKLAKERVAGYAKFKFWFIRLDQDSQ